MSLTTFEGETTDLHRFVGTPLVVNFWASWCPPCAAEMPDFQTVSQQLGEQVQFVGINTSDDAGLADDLAERTGVTYDLLRDPDGHAFRAFGSLVCLAQLLLIARLRSGSRRERLSPPRDRRPDRRRPERCDPCRHQRPSSPAATKHDGLATCSQSPPLIRKWRFSQLHSTSHYPRELTKTVTRDLRDRNAEHPGVHA